MSNLIKKSFLISMVALTAMWGTFGVVSPAAANVAVAGDLIKSTSSPAVYYLDSANVKHPFHHEREYMTWYDNFNGVKTIPTDEMVSYTLGSTIVVRPGSRMVQYVEVLGDGTWNVANTPEVYAVGADGTLHHLDSAATAVAFYGANWESMIVPLPNYLAANYTTGAALTSSSNYPTGTLVKESGSAQVYYIDGSSKRPVTDAGMTGNRFNSDFVVTASSVSGYTDGTSITAEEEAISQPIAGESNLPGGSGLTVGLSSSSPGAQVVPLSATNVSLMKFNLTASSDGAVTVDSIYIKRLGVGATTDFAYLYLYEGADRLTNGKTINSTTHKVQFTNLAFSISAGTTKTITLSADISTGTAGDVSYFQIEAADISTTATVNGSFPVLSDTVTLGSTTAGSVKVDKDGTLSNPSVGQENVKIAQFKMTAGTPENLNINRITLYEAGTLNNNYLTDLKLYQNTTLLASAASVSSKGYVVFDLSASPYVLAKGTNRIFHVTATIGTSARNADTIRTYVDQTTDIYAIGASYGYGASVDIGATSGLYDGTASTKYSEVTVQGGQITVAMNGPDSGTLAVGSDEAVLLKFGITSAVNAEIRAMRIELHKTSTDLDTDTGSDCASGTDYIANVKVVDVDNGESTSAVNCGSFSEISGSNNGLQYGYTDYFTLTAGQTRNFEVKADFNASLTAGTYYATLGSSLTTFYTFSSTAIKNTDNNQYVTDIVPSTFTQGNNQTVSSAGLYVSASSNAVGISVIQGDQDVTLAKFALQALEGSDITISGMSIYGYVDGDGAGGTSTVMSLAYSDDVQEAGMAAVGNVYVNNLVENLRIYDLTADPSMEHNLNSTIESFASTTGLATFSNINWTIPAGQTHILAVVGDVTNTAFSNGDTGANGTVGMEKYVKVNFGTNAGITAVDEDSNTVTMLDSASDAWTCVDGNGVGDTCATAVASGGYAIDSDAYIAIQASGTLNAYAESNPAIANVVAGSSDVPVLTLKYHATYEPFVVNKMNITQSQTTSFSRAVESVTISYKNQAGATVEATQTLISNEADFNITSNPIYVAADSNSLVYVYYNLTEINSTNAAYTGDMVKATFDGDNSFEAKGVGSSSTNLTSTSNFATDGNINGNAMTVHGSLPTITVDNTTNTNLISGPAELYRWQVTASEGGTEVSLKKLSFKLSMTDSVLTTATLNLGAFAVFEGDSYANVTGLSYGDTNTTNYYQVYNAYGVTTTIANGTGTGGKLGDASALMYYNYAGHTASTSHDVVVVFNDDRLISPGTSKYYILKATAGNVNAGASSNDSISAYMYDGDSSTTASASTATGNRYLEASCDSTGTNGRGGKYCLSTNGTANDTAAYMLWSDSTGTDGNFAHIDTAADATASTADWFNGYKVKTLNVTRTLN